MQSLVTKEMAKGEGEDSGKDGRMDGWKGGSERASDGSQSCVPRRVGFLWLKENFISTCAWRRTTPPRGDAKRLQDPFQRQRASVGTEAPQTGSSSLSFFGAQTSGAHINCAGKMSHPSAETAPERSDGRRRKKKPGPIKLAFHCCQER